MNDMSHGNPPAPKTGIVDPAIATSMSGLAFMHKLMNEELPAPPFSLTADVWPVEVEDGRVVFEGRPSERFYNPMGTIHGGWLSTLLDSAMGCAIHSHLPPGAGYTTVEMKVNFVRPAFAHTGPLRCEASLMHYGGRIATSEGRIIDGKGRLIAHGTETCMLLDTTRAAHA
ncbi:PaaI family thioesterase [Sinimarinibacterium sp. CAU 1509]|uniref:PaaI family thioesterase n=1 Tax=Sinimarinibacterium sp. CAU 1509 TaxID=2562283 RepID=UPI0010AB9366|nr:PaaI family thioesterase [Sinimarinibacterium sp. CAU 1509]TJY55921.1 PaaI family thioesterase [Sinimarinibacterium sp. CAU 1509]